MWLASGASLHPFGALCIQCSQRRTPGATASLRAPIWPVVQEAEPLKPLVFALRQLSKALRRHTATCVSVSSIKRAVSVNVTA